MIVVIMGVSGAGKSAVGQRLAQRTGWVFRDADDFHSSESIAKMRSGLPLEDSDRSGWLERLHELLVDTNTTGISLVLACSALKADFRNRLRAGIANLRFVHLRVPRQELERRLARRRDHFFPPALLDSQLAALEEPADAIAIDATSTLEEVVTLILERLAWRKP